MRRNEIADLILQRFENEKINIKRSISQSQSKIPFFIIDKLLPEAVASNIFERFPEPKSMRLNKSIREYKFVAAQMYKYDPILEETTFAFQDKRIVATIGEFFGIKSLAPDEYLYAGGISMMGNKQFLNPHIDNSHDKDRRRWRVLNLLYYVSPNWSLENGGNLKLWPDGLGQPQTVIHSKFNRLAVMATHDKSWHSVSPVDADAFRCCVSNYYFSDNPLHEADRFHVTSFRGRPEQRLTDIILRGDIAARSAIRKIFPKGGQKNPHVYKRNISDQS